MAKNKNKTKCDLACNWAKASFIPEENEIIIYSDIKKMKIGDGKTKLQDLDFAIKTYNGERSNI